MISVARTVTVDGNNRVVTAGGNGEVVAERRVLPVPAHQQVTDIDFVTLGQREVGPGVRCSVTAGSVVGIEQVINQRIAVGAASQAIGIDGTHHLRIHIDGQRSGIGMAIQVVKGVGKCLFGDDGGERDIAVEGIGVMTINANGQFAVQPVNDGAGRAAQRIQCGGAAARAIHR